MAHLPSPRTTLVCRYQQKFWASLAIFCTCLAALNEITLKLIISRLIEAISNMVVRMFSKALILSTRNVVL